jgi:hypothetical protein
MADEPSEREILWRDYALSADLYKFYLDIIVKVNVLYYAITGGIVSFCLTQQAINYAKWGLVLPLLMSVCLTALFVCSAPLAVTLRAENYALAEKLGIEASHDFTPLIFTLWMFSGLQIMGAVGLIVLLCLL